MVIENRLSKVISIVAFLIFLASTSQAFSTPISNKEIMAPSSVPAHRRIGLRKRQMLGDFVAQKVNNQNIASVLPMCLRPGCCPPASPSPLSVLYCSAVTDASDSESEASLEIKATTTASSWKEKLLRFSNFASFLCVLDCTILPVITLLLPLLGVVAASPVQMEWLHELGHSVALYFVLPVGFMATTTNYLYNHRRVWITALGWLGLGLIFASNAGCTLVGHHHPLHQLLHLVAHGVAHRVANLSGCALLIVSNLISRRRHKCSHGPNCSHNHIIL